MTWFKQLMGFEESNFKDTQSKIEVKGENIVSLVNNKSYQYGSLELSSLIELRNKTQSIELPIGKISLEELVGDVKEVHTYSKNKNALFQAASQFNLLEMVGPSVSPEHGIGRYENDLTQGPACAIACGAGTIYRNYFAKVNNQIGQNQNHQIDCLSLLADFFDNENKQLWTLRNGYAIPREGGLEEINTIINSLKNEAREHLKGLLKVGVQWDAEVTISENQNIVSQIYCSAMPVAYTQYSTKLWQPLASLILEATYEATFRAALLNAKINKCNKLFLTLVGGGAFGNDEQWIKTAILQNLSLFKDYPLEIYIVSYGQSNNLVQEIIKEYSTRY